MVCCAGALEVDLIEIVIGETWLMDSRWELHSFCFDIQYYGSQKSRLMSCLEQDGFANINASMSQSGAEDPGEWWHIMPDLSINIMTIQTNSEERFLLVVKRCLDCVSARRRIDCCRSEISPHRSGLVVGHFSAILRVSRRGSRQHFCSSDLISHTRTRINTSDAEHGPLVRWSSNSPVLAMGADRLFVARSDSPDRTGRKVL